MLNFTHEWDIEISYLDWNRRAYFFSNKNVDIKFSMHDIFLEKYSSCTPKVKIFESQYNEVDKILKNCWKVKTFILFPIKF